MKFQNKYLSNDTFGKILFKFITFQLILGISFILFITCFNWTGTIGKFTLLISCISLMIVNLIISIRKAKQVMELK